MASQTILAQKRIDDLKAVDDATVLHVFAEQDFAASLLRGMNGYCIPKGKSVQTIDVDG